MSQGKTYELVPPDGGYGYLILLCFIINLSTLNAYMNCYGIVYKDFFIELGMDSTNVTFLSGVSGTSTALGGLIVPYLLKRMTKRKIALIGAALWNCGIFCTVFAQSKIYLFIFQGIVQNAGQGFIFNISSTALNEYFVKKRSLAVSVSQMLLALVCLAAPQIFKWSIHNFGHRGTLIWLTAISMHMFIAIALMQPVSWHMKKVEISTKEHELKILLKENLEITAAVTDGTTINLDKFPNGVSKASTQKKIMVFINGFKGLNLVTDFMLSIECLGATTVIAMEFTYLMILPQALQSFNWSEDDIAFAFSLVAAGDLTMRILMIVFNKWMNKWGSRTVYAFGIMIAVASRLGSLTSDNRMLIYGFITLMGMARCIVLVVIVLVISESVKEDKFSAALGIFMTIMGILSLTMGPLIGAIRDYTDSYTIIFYLMTAIMGLVGIVWILKLIFAKKRSKTIDRETY